MRPRRCFYSVVIFFSAVLFYFLEKMAKFQLLFFILKEKLTFINFEGILSERGDMCHFLFPLVP